MRTINELSRGELNIKIDIVCNAKSSAIMFDVVEYLKNKLRAILLCKHRTFTRRNSVT